MRTNLGHIFIKADRWRMLFPVWLLICVLVSAVFMSPKAYGVAKTWDGGCGIDTSWSCADNWSAAGGDNNTVPTSADTVTFNATSTNNSTVDASFAGTITSLTIASGYTGTITMARSLTLSSNFSQAAGSFTAADQNLDINGTFSLSAGSFTASSGTTPTTGTSVAGTISITASVPTFNANNGLFVFDVSSATIGCGGMTFNLVRFTHTAGTKTVSSNCDLNLEAGATLPAAVTLNGTLRGTGTLTTSSSMTLNSTAVLAGFNGLTMTGALVLTGATLDLSSYSSVDLNSSLTLTTASNAVLTAPASTTAMKVAGAISLNSGNTFNHNSSTIELDGGTATVNCTGSPFNKITISAGAKTAGTGCDLALGSNPTLPTAVTINGSLSGIGKITFGSASTFNSPAPLSGFTAIATTSTLTISTASSHLNLNGYSEVDINGSFVLNSPATFTAPAGTMTSASTFTINAGATFNANGGTLVFDGTSGSAVITCNDAAFGTLKFEHGGSSTKTISSGCSLDLGNNPTIGKSDEINPDVVVNGELTGTGILRHAAMNAGNVLTLNSTGSIQGFSGFTLGTLTISGTTFDAEDLSPFDIEGNFTLSSSAVFEAPSATINITRALTINAGTTFNHNGGTVVFDGTGSGAITCNGAEFNLVQFRHTSGIKSIQSGCDLPVGHNPQLASDSEDMVAGPEVVIRGTLSGSGTLTMPQAPFVGVNYTVIEIGEGGVLNGFNAIVASDLYVDNTTLDLSSYESMTVEGLVSRNNGILIAPETINLYEISGDVDGKFTSDACSFYLITGGQFLHNNGTVNMSGNNCVLWGDFTFYNLININSEAKSLSWDGGVTQTIEGELTLRGAPGQLLTINSVTAGEAALLDAQGPVDIEYVHVKDISNISGTDITAADSTSGGNNTGWVFTKTGTPGTEEFTDVTAASGLSSHFSNAYSHGAAWGDANGDGHVDLYMGTFISGARTEPSHLFLGDGDGNFTESDQAVLNTSARTSGAVMADLDNDGDQDLVVSNNTKDGDANPIQSAANYLFKNNGDGTYTDISAASGLQANSKRGRSIGVLDYNNDGYLDLVMHADALLAPVGVMRLMKNDRDMTFTNVTAAAGLPANLAGLGMGVADANGDGWPDIAITGGISGLAGDEFANSYLFINDQDGTFHDATPDDAAWEPLVWTGSGYDTVTDEDWTAGIAWGDVNRDGRLDLVVSHHFFDALTFPVAPRLYINRGNDSSGDPVLEYQPQALEPVGSKAPHVEIRDIDNDGWPDIYTSLLINTDEGQNLFVYHNTGDLDDGVPTFTTPYYDSIEYYAPGSPLADFDEDGKLDVFFEGFDVFNTPTLWRNTTANSNHWLQVKVTNPANTAGIGAKVAVYSAGHVGESASLLGYEEVTTGNGYSSGSDPTAHFGLGVTDKVDVRITLPNDGGSTDYANISANQLAELEAEATDTTPTPEPDPDNESGANTGSGSNAQSNPDEPVAPEEDNEVIVLDELPGFTTNEVLKLKLKVGQVLSYELARDGQSETHTITVKKIGKNYVIVTFASTPTDVKIKLGQTVRRDVDDDGEADVAVTLTKIKNKVATLAIEKLARPADGGQPSAPATTSRGLGGGWLWLGLVAGIGILGLVQRRRLHSRVQP